MSPTSLNLALLTQTYDKAKKFNPTIVLMPSLNNI